MHCACDCNLAVPLCWPSSHELLLLLAPLGAHAHQPYHLLVESWPVTYVAYALQEGFSATCNRSNRTGPDAESMLNAHTLTPQSSAA